MFLVIAYRYGNTEGYQFPVGVSTTEKEAVDIANKHKTFRGGKYEHKVFPFKVDVMYDAEEMKGTWVKDIKA